MADETMFQIRGEDPLDAGPALYSNFVGVSRVGSDIQFEFVFVDLNQIATILEDRKKGGQVPTKIEGKTVAKIVMPGASLVQVRGHINSILDIVEKNLRPQEAKAQ